MTNLPPLSQTTTGRAIAIRADMWPHERLPGHHGIEAAGIRIAKSRYAINRMAKALFDRGYRGTMEVYGPSADGTRIILRFTCIIEKNAARQLTETSAGGFRRIQWSEMMLAALEAAIEVIPGAVSGDPQSVSAKPPDDASSRSSAPGIDGDDRSPVSTGCGG